MSRPSNIQPSHAAAPDFHCVADRSRSVTCFAEAASDSRGGAKELSAMTLNWRIGLWIDYLRLPDGYARMLTCAGLIARYLPLFAVISNALGTDSKPPSTCVIADCR